MGGRWAGWRSDGERLREETLTAYRQGADTVVELVERLVGTLAEQMESVTARDRDGGRVRGAAGGEPGAARSAWERQPQQQQAAIVGWAWEQTASEEPSGGERAQAGGQPGHRGHTEQVETPDAVAVDRPATRRGCGERLDQASVIRRERRQVMDLPPLRVQVTEYQAETRALWRLWGRDERAVPGRGRCAGPVRARGGDAGGVPEPGAVAARGADLSGAG